MAEPAFDETVKWDKGPIPARLSRYECGYCGRPVGCERNFVARGPNTEIVGFILICASCFGPTFVHTEATGDNLTNWKNPRVLAQVPGAVAAGGHVEGVPKDVGRMYAEARKSATAGAHTASVMACRKILMNIAVAKGAKAGETYASYVSWLDREHYIPPGSADWVEFVRSRGNEANHEIELMDESDSTALIRFVETLLKVIYEMPSLTPSKGGGVKSTGPAST